MKRRPPISTRTDTLFPYTTLFRAAFDPVRILEADPAARVDRRTAAGGERHMGAVRARLADRAVEHLPHQPLRAVRAEAGVSEPAGRSTVSAQVPPAVLLPAGPASALCRLHHRLLGDAGDDAGAHAVFGRDDDLHIDR